MNKIIGNFVLIMAFACGMFYFSAAQGLLFAEQTQMTGFSPTLTPQANGFTQYRARYFGGYSFKYGSKWKNTANFDLEGRLNVITFALASDAKQSLNLTVSQTSAEDSGKPIGLKKKLGTSLEKRGIKYTSLVNRALKIGNQNCEIAEASLENKKNIMMLAMQYEGLSLVGTLGYFPNSKALSQQDLIDLFSSFRKSSVSKP